MPGQINQGWPLGDQLYELASESQVNNVLEIGTWHGDGSTMVLAKALAETGGTLWSVELKRENYDLARELYRDSGLPVRLVLGLSISPWWYPPFEHFWPRIRATRQEALEPGSYLEWYEDELAHAWLAPQHSVLERLVQQEGPFDLVLFDGGEFASDHEFELLEPHVSGYVVMDDTNHERCIKNAQSRQRVLASADWDVVADEIDQRNGWLAARRRA